MRHKRAESLRFLAIIASVAAIAMLAGTSSTAWETGGPQDEAGTSPAGIGGVSLAPPVSYTEVPVVETRPHETGPQEPLNFTLPTNVDHDGAIVEAASARVRQLGGVLSEAEMRAVLTVAGWPEVLHSEALAVAYGESRWSPYAVSDSGQSLGFFQLNGVTWSRYCGVSPEALFDVLVNAKCAYQVYLYDISRGQRPWQQWSVRWEHVVLP